jgi:hypothetical protein
MRISTGMPSCCGSVASWTKEDEMDSPWIVVPDPPAWPPISTTAPLPPEEFAGQDSVEIAEESDALQKES